MAITPKTRKQLWARSGNICAICYCHLAENETEEDSFSIIGDECHIISKKPNGPRYIPNFGDYDDISNLIILCKTHHKMVDDQFKKYSIDYLRSIKSKHEKWVADSLKKDKKNFSKSKYSKDSFLPRITSGKELFNILWNAHLYAFDYCELNTKEERETVSIFFQFLEDYGDLSTEIEIGARIEVDEILSEQLKNLETLGLWVFGIKGKKKMPYGDKTEYWPMPIIVIIRKDDPSIITIGVQ